MNKIAQSRLWPLVLLALMTLFGAFLGSLYVLAFGAIWHRIGSTMLGGVKYGALTGAAFGLLAVLFDLVRGYLKPRLEFLSILVSKYRAVLVIVTGMVFWWAVRVWSKGLTP